MGKTEDVNPWLIDVRGWLQNKARKTRRDQAFTLIDDEVHALLSKIDETEKYTKLRPKFDALIRARDKALISVAWTFFKRGSEVLAIQLKDVTYNNEELSVTFYIKKKTKKFKICPDPECKDKKGKRTKNSRASNFCKICGIDIKNAEFIEVGPKDRKFTKNRTMKDKFCQIFVNWIRTLTALGCSEEAYVFPRFVYLSKNITYEFDFDNHLTVGRFSQILHRLDDTLFTAVFRYAASEKYLRLGYSREQLAEIGDWESAYMPERYAKKKSITPTQRKWSEDLR